MTDESIVNQEYAPIELATLRVNTIPDFEVYLCNESQGRYVLYRGRDTAFREADRLRLIENHVVRLYVPAADRRHFQVYVEDNLGGIVADEAVPAEQKARIIYQAASGRVREVLDNPEVGDNVRRSRGIVENVVRFILTHTHAIKNLIAVSSFDYEVYTHSVNVCTYGLSLARQLNVCDLGELGELGVGMLLHDCGKSRVPMEILKKPGRLTPEELHIVRQHPAWGYETLKKVGGVSGGALEVVLHHHERADGNGYPEGRTLADIPFWARLCALADVFDALSTRRSYKDAIPPFDALKVMANEMSEQLDPDLLVRLILLLGPQDSHPSVGPIPADLLARLVAAQ